MASSPAADGSGSRSAPGSPMPQHPCRRRPGPGPGRGPVVGRFVGRFGGRSRSRSGCRRSLRHIETGRGRRGRGCGDVGLGAARSGGGLRGRRGRRGRVRGLDSGEHGPARRSGRRSCRNVGRFRGRRVGGHPLADQHRLVGVVPARRRRVQRRDLRRCRRPRGCGRRRAGRVGPFGIVVQPVLDHLERQEVLPLLAEHPAQALHIVLVELPVARRGPLGVHQSLTLQKADLRDGDVGEFLSQERQHVADGQIRPAAHRASAPTATLGTGALIRPRPPGTRA